MIQKIVIRKSPKNVKTKHLLKNNSNNFTILQRNRHVLYLAYQEAGTQEEKSPRNVELQRDCPYHPVTSILLKKTVSHLIAVGPGWVVTAAAAAAPLTVSVLLLINSLLALCCVHIGHIGHPVQQTGVTGAEKLTTG